MRMDVCLSAGGKEAAAHNEADSIAAVRTNGQLAIANTAVLDGDGL